MRAESRSRAFLIPAAFAACLLAPAAGCGGNPNEAENAKTMAPGIPSANPNESFADRRARTRQVSKQEQKNEERNQAIAAKNAAKAGAKAETKN
ncbi:hypothetical protein OJF2_69450 [Aquisphaera giovannonii]|uniref:Lipoprotein n=1 Tax=Aquisphaera giovannonii TaxID=406548 RepID=A0A5B9WDJ7_9BACT|nr:hypothetical protein [Aquisphaera giovannonii]QEH38344.1 hypothetical protein OJF2_69450 [Aquisphaera giovannonii]